MATPAFDLANVPNIPDEIKEVPNWVCWREETRDGKTTKVPINPNHPGTGTRASSTDKESWVSFDQALSVATSYSYGVGFVFNGSGFVGTDIDKGINADGSLTSEAARIVRALNSYTELSPSGNGVHIITRGLWNDTGRKVKLPTGEGLETYSTSRFFTFTGKHLASTPDSIDERQDELDVFHTNYFEKASDDSDSEPTIKGVSRYAGTDEELIEDAKRAANGDKFISLFVKGDTSDFNGDKSAADFSLLTILAFWTTRDHERMERLFNRSPLSHRDKWKDRSDYKTRSIKNACKLVPPGEAFGESQEQPKPQDEGSRVTHFKIYTLDELSRIPSPPTLIGNVLDAGFLGLVAPGGNFKTFLAISWGVALASGMDWFGHRVTEQSPVLYLSAEGAGKFWVRTYAAMRALGIDPATVDIPFFVLPEALQLQQEKGIAQKQTRVISDVDSLIEDIKALRLQPGLIVVDTLARYMPGGDENSSKEMGSYVAGCDAIQRAVGGRATMSVHHTGKSKDSARGSSALPFASDEVFFMTRATIGRANMDEELPREFARVLYTTHIDEEGKRKDREAFRMEVILSLVPALDRVGNPVLREDGSPDTTLAVSGVDINPENAKKEARGEGMNYRVLYALRALEATAGGQAVGFSTIVEKTGSDKPTTVQSALTRLVGKGWVENNVDSKKRYRLTPEGVKEAEEVRLG